MDSQLQSNGQAPRKRKLADTETLADDLERPRSVPQVIITQANSTPKGGISKKDNLSGSAPDASLPTPPVEEDGSAPSSSSTSASGLVGINTSSGVPAATSTVTAAPPAKRTRTTFTPAEKAQRAAEKEQKAAEKAEKEQKTAAEKAQRAAEKAQRDSDKAHKEAQKVTEKAQRDSEKAQKDAEKAQKDAEKVAQKAQKAQKDAIKFAKVDEKRKAEEKASRAQLKLGSFFVPVATNGLKPSGKVFGNKLRTSLSPTPDNALDTDSVMSDEIEATHYETLFSDFFLREDTELAPYSRFERDEEASEIVGKAIDSYMTGNRSPGRERKYDAVSLYHLDSIPKRGRKQPSVRAIMNQASPQAIDLTTDSQNNQILRARDMLKRVPMKLIQFQEDVRPPYRGTFTSQPLHGLEKLARNPFRRDRSDTNYDDDSEAEWVEGGEDEGEDLRSEADDDDDDEDEDMDDFLDDDNDESAARRLIPQGDLEPVSTGLCWEDKDKRNSNLNLMSYRMEVILDVNLKSIDPFSTSYWEPSPQPGLMLPPPPRLPLNAVNPPNALAKNNSSLQTFFTPTADATLSKPAASPAKSKQPAAAAADGSSNPKKIIPAKDMPAFRAAIQGSKLSKVGLIEALKVQFPGRGAAAIKDTLEQIATKVGKKRAETSWVLNEDTA